LHLHDAKAKLPASEFVFSGQPVHATAVPRAILKVPAAHAMHCTPLLLAINPGLQSHAVIIVLATNEFVFSGQSVQDPMPGKFLYFPVAHASHAIAVNKAKNPGLHRHNAMSAFPTEEFVFVGHVVHEGAGPTISLYVPDGHNEHWIPFAFAVDPVLQVHDVISILAVGELVFAGHVEHTPGPAKFLYCPVLHATQFVCNWGAANPFRHKHDAILMLPTGVNVFKGQSLQRAVPVFDLNLPSTHNVHAMPLDMAVDPALQKHAAMLMLAAGECVLDGHDVQLPAPVAALCVPAKQSVQSTPFDTAVVPATQEHDSKAVLPCGELVFTGHGKQGVGPGLGLYVPWTHNVHITPFDAAVDPALHVHDVGKMLETGEFVFCGQPVQIPGPVSCLY